VEKGGVYIAIKTLLVDDEMHMSTWKAFGT
jgi:hypothetical protein